MELFAQPFRRTVRKLFRQPGFTLVTVLTLPRSSTRRAEQAALQELTSPASRRRLQPLDT